MNMTNQASVEFPSNSCNEAFARAVAAAFASQLDPTLEELADVKTAVSEAVTNCIVHAYPDRIGMIRMELSICDPRTLELVIEDRGVGIPDVDQARQPMYSTGGEERSGMGFTIMERFMSELEVESRPGQGTRVRMRRSLGAEEFDL